MDHNLEGSEADRAGREAVAAATRAWREADEEARRAELRFAQAWGDLLLGGPPVPQELAAEVERLRARARERLSAALALMGL